VGENVDDLEADRIMLRWLQDQIRTSVPAVVKTYDPAQNVATVQLARRNRTPDGRIYGPEEFVGLKVEWPRGGGWILRWELSPGDPCRIQVQDRSIAEFATAGKVTDPQWRWMHRLADGVVIPGFPVATKPAPGGDGRMWLGREDGTATIMLGKAGDVEINGAVSIKLGTGATLGVARLTDKTSPDATMATWIAGAQTVLAAAAAFLAIAPPVAPSDFGVISTASTKAKSE
jgi:hypothetical protein